MRIPQPRWKKSHRCYYVRLKGKFIRLDPDEKKAYQLYSELLTRYKLDEGLTAQASLTVRELLLTFLDWTQQHKAEDTYLWYKKYILGIGGKTGTYKDAGFANYVSPQLLVRDLKPHHLRDWLDSRYADVGESTRAGAVRAIKRVFNWASSDSEDCRGYIDENPLRKVKARAPKEGRGEVAYLLPEQWQQVLETVKAGLKDFEVEPFLDYITVMRLTGCRPQEIRIVEARHLDVESKEWRFSKQESKGRKVRRTVPVSHPLALQICRKLALRDTGGKLFRNSDGQPWTNFAIACRCKRLSDKLGFKVFAYAIRHTFASDAIIAGVDLITIARIMGHTDLTMLNRIYQHVMKDRGHIEAAIMKATERAAM
jgi:integrase/recombinase XerC